MKSMINAAWMTVARVAAMHRVVSKIGLAAWVLLLTAVLIQPVLRAQMMLGGGPTTIDTYIPTPVNTGDNGPKSEGNCGCNGAGDPINVATGNLYEVETDFLGAANTGLKLIRYYNSQDSFAWRFGAQWRSTWDRYLSNSSGVAKVLREDGRVDTFTLNAQGIWQADPDVTSTLIALGSNTQPTGWQLVRSDDSTETYTSDGRLASITTRAGLVTKLRYDSSNRLTSVTGPFGRALAFTYDSSNHINTMQVPDGGTYSYAYDTDNNLVSVTYPDTSSRQYLYQEGYYGFLNALTGIVDENGVQYATFFYDASGHAYYSYLGNEAADYTEVIFNSGQPAVVYNANGSHTYAFTSLYGVSHPSAITGTPTWAAGASAYTYDANGFVASSTDFNGNVTTYQNNSRGLPVARTEASGTGLARTTTTSWLSNYHLPAQIVQPTQTTNLAYDSHGNLLSQAVTAGKTTRTWNYTYNSAGQVLTAKGPRTDVNELTTYTYDKKGDLATMTDALGHVTAFTSYDTDGRLLSSQDPNGLVTKLAYDSRGRLLSRSVAGLITNYAYDLAGNLIKRTNPDGSFLAYAYDGAHRLIGVSDTLGNSIAYTLDYSGNTTQEQRLTPTSSVALTRSYTYDTNNVLNEVINAEGNAFTYNHDANGNLISTVDPLGNETQQQVDALNRLSQRVNANGGVTALEYDAGDHLTQVQDPRGLVTAYTVDGLGDVLATSSPDTGKSKNTFDSAGDTVVKTDARGQKVNMSYDALGRLTQEQYATDPAIVYTYDQGTNGVGHLTQMADVSGTTSWTYDVLGHVISQTYNPGTISLSVQYAYDASGRLASVTYPSGNVVALTYTKGLPTELSLNGAPIVKGVTYKPFGPPAAWKFGNGSAVNWLFDQDGRPTQYPMGGGRTRQVSYDTASRISGYTDTDTTQNQTFSYDAASQLTSFSVGGNQTGYTYDANGNRTSAIVGSQTVDFTNDAASNRLLSVNNGAITQTYTYDKAGNVINDGVDAMTYDGRGRLNRLSGPNGLYTYRINGLGQRVAKMHAKTDTYVIYDLAGHVLGEYNAAGTAIEETVWFGDAPVVVLAKGGKYFAYADHLNAPRGIENSTRTAVWRWDSDPFGTTAANSNPGGGSSPFVYNLRFPGQYFDAETSRHYNMARDYAPLLGRYIESDPIGLGSGINTYAYVGASPIARVDFGGLDDEAYLMGATWIPEVLKDQVNAEIKGDATAAGLVVAGLGSAAVIGAGTVLAGPYVPAAGQILLGAYLKDPDYANELIETAANEAYAQFTGMESPPTSEVSKFISINAVNVALPLCGQ